VAESKDDSTSPSSAAGTVGVEVGGLAFPLTQQSAKRTSAKISWDLPMPVLREDGSFIGISGDRESLENEAICAAWVPPPVPPRLT
jgi:hypothetical protein